jgi:hypothetical protein
MGLVATLAMLPLVLTVGATGGALANVWVGLLTAFIGTPNKNSVIGDLTEASFSGYSRQQVTTWSAPIFSSDGTVKATGNQLPFTPTDGLAPNVIQGLFYADASVSGRLLGVQIFDTPISLIDTHSRLLATPEIALDPAGNYGACEIDS